MPDGAHEARIGRRRWDRLQRLSHFHRDFRELRTISVSILRRSSWGATAGVKLSVIGQFENVAGRGNGGPVPSRQAAKKTVNQRDIEEDARRSPALPLRPFSCTFGTALTMGRGFPADWSARFALRAGSTRIRSARCMAGTHGGRPPEGEPAVDESINHRGRVPVDASGDLFRSFTTNSCSS